MTIKPFSFLGSAICALLTVVLAACTPNVKGLYICEDSPLDTVKLESGGKAYITATLFGVKSENAGTYTVDDDRVVVSYGGQSTVFTLKDKTLDAGVAGKCTAR
jgi:hypothetical protein